MIHIQVYLNPPAVAQAAAELVYNRLRRHTDTRRYAFALSGGSTPRLMYEKLRQFPNVADLINAKAEVFFSDERAVAGESTESNYHTAVTGLLRPLGVREDIVLPIRGDASDPRAEAARYELLIKQRVPTGPSGTPTFDLVILGMGSDGHVASLFPGFDPGEQGTSLVAAPYVESRGAFRLTFTLRLINQARTVLFMATGEEKAETVKKVLSLDGQGDILPASRVEAAETIWMIDAAAASELPTDRLRGTIERC